MGEEITPSRLKQLVDEVKADDEVPAALKVSLINRLSEIEAALVHQQTCECQQIGGGKTKQEVYTDRNLLACALAAFTGCDAGWFQDPMDEAWAIVWIDSPEGQVSWHVPWGLVVTLPIPEQEYEWDGHDRVEKNDRLERWIRSQATGVGSGIDG